ncbi:MAG: endonuclease domain-containing protein [Actinomycetota bacterium]
MESELERYAAHNYGVWSRAEALARGTTPNMISNRLSSGAWLLLLPNVYTGRMIPSTWHGQVLAATLWGGPDAAAGGFTAAALWGMPVARRNNVEIVTTRCLRSRAGITVRRPSLLNPEIDVIEIAGIRVTTVERTLLDLGYRVRREFLEVLFEDCRRRLLVDLDGIARIRRRAGGKGRWGSAGLRYIAVTLDPDDHPGHSDFEIKLRQVLRRGGLPQPIAQFPVGDSRGFVGTMDFAYPEAKILIEADSEKHHGNRLARQWDAERRTRLISAGWIVLVFTYHDVTRRPSYVIEQVCSALRRAA